MGRLFGTDGVRGIANITPMTAEMVLEIGRATAYVCKRHSQHRNRVVIGKDTRISGYMMENALTAGICSMGVDVFLVGPMPTPGIAFITHSMRADAGLVISASHNPYQDNGIKIFSRDGYKLPDVQEDEIEELITSGHIKDIRPTATDIGRAKRIDDAIGRYIVFCKNTFPDKFSLDGMKIVLDCANGASYKVAPIIFAELGAEVIPIHNTPNGVNINDHCGSQHPADLIDKVKETGACAGLAFDGDGDRMIAVDENGKVLTGDHILAVCARMYKEQGWLDNNHVVATVMSNVGFMRALDELDIHYTIAPVGDRYVLEKMKETGAVLGGEVSGHIICHNHHTTGDGIICALQLLSAMRFSNKPLSDLAGLVELFPQSLINVPVRDMPPLDSITEVRDAIVKVEDTLKNKGRVLVRYSGTQPVCRVMVEAPTRDETEQWVEFLADVIHNNIGAVDG